MMELSEIILPLIAIVVCSLLIRSFYLDLYTNKGYKYKGKINIGERYFYKFEADNDFEADKYEEIKILDRKGKHLKYKYVDRDFLSENILEEWILRTNIYKQKD